MGACLRAASVCLSICMSACLSVFLYTVIGRAKVLKLKKMRYLLQTSWEFVVNDGRRECEEEENDDDDDDDYDDSGEVMLVDKLRHSITHAVLAVCLSVGLSVCLSVPEIS